MTLFKRIQTQIQTGVRMLQDTFPLISYWVLVTNIYFE